jgi:hypothetical protein
MCEMGHERLRRKKYGNRNIYIKIHDSVLSPPFLPRFCKKTVGKNNENHYSISREPFSIRFKT